MWLRKFFRKLADRRAEKNYIPRDDLPFAGKQIQPGQNILIHSRHYQVLSYIDQGKKGAVYKVQHQRDFYAFKIALNNEFKTLRSFREEQEKAAILEKYGFAYPKLLEIGEDYIIKEWIEGQRLNQWRDLWEAEGFPADSVALKKLFALILKAAAQRVYLGDLNQHNLIWNGQDWIIIDYGIVRERYGVKRSLNRYRERLSQMWVLDASSECKQQLSQYWESYTQTFQSPVLRRPD